MSLRVIQGLWVREWLWIGGQRAGGAARIWGSQGRGNGAAAPGFRFGVKGFSHRVSIMRGSGTLVQPLFSCLKAVMSNSSL